jgi:L-threonate 2-dehydrogenase
MTAPPAGHPVGLIGLGIMGSAMAPNLLKAGFNVVGYDVDPGRCAAASAAGVAIVSSAADVAAKAHDILVSLPSAKAVHDTAAALAACKTKLTVVETSTLSLDDKMAFHDTLSAAGHVALDCPLSGTGAQALTKDLVVFASGSAEATHRLEPVFLGFARKVQQLGAYGNGSKMKFIANLLVAIHNVAAAEAMVLGMKAGLDPDQIVDVVGSGAGTSRMFEMRAPLMARNTYTPATMRNRIWKKDMAIIGEFASGLDCPTPLFTLTNAYYEAAVAMGRGEEDTAAVCAVLEQMAGPEALKRYSAARTCPIAAFTAGSTFSAINTMERRPSSRSAQSCPAYSSVPKSPTCSRNARIWSTT